MNILSMDYYNYFVTKISLNNAPYRKFSLKCKQHPKIRKRKCLFNKVLTIPLYCKIMVEPYYIKGVRKQLFADVLIGVLENFTKFTGKHLLFHKVSRIKRLHHKCFPMIFAKFSRTPIF